MDQDNDTPPADAGAPDGLGHILAEAHAVEASSTPPDFAAQQQEQQATQDAAQAAAHTEEMADALEFGWSLIGPFLPQRYADQYGPEQRANIARAWGPLAVKHGWSVGGALGKFGPELAFGAALLGPALPVAMADFKAAQEAKRRPPPALRPPPPPPTEAGP